VGSRYFRIEAKISSALLVQMKGLGSLFQLSVHS